MIRKGKSSAQKLMKARILLKADVSEDGEGWIDSRIIEALDTSATTVYRTLQQLVEEGFETVLRRKKPTKPSVTPIFDGEKVKLIALACSEPPNGREKSLGSGWMPRCATVTRQPCSIRSPAIARPIWPVPPKIKA